MTKNLGLELKEEFERDAVPSPGLEEVRREIVDSELPFPAGHEFQLGRDRDWSYLNGRVVGAEIESRLYS